ARDGETVRHVRACGFAIERLELVADRHALVELTQRGRAQLPLQLELSDENDLKQLFLVGLEVGQDADLLEHGERQGLCLVDDEHRARLQRNQTEEEIVQRVDQRLLADAREPAGLRVLARDDAEVLENPLQQVLLREKRVQHERRERRPVDLLEQRAAQRRLARADVPGDDDEAFAATDGVLQQVERVAVRLAAIEILRVRRQAERLFGEPVIRFVHVLAYWAITPGMIFGVNRITSSTRRRVTIVLRPTQPPLVPTVLRSRVSRAVEKPDTTSVSPSATRATRSASATCGPLTIGLTLSVSDESPEICGVTLSVTTSPRTIAGSLFIVSTRGVERAVTVPCASSRL